MNVCRRHHLAAAIHINIYILCTKHVYTSRKSYLHILFSKLQTSHGGYGHSAKTVCVSVYREDWKKKKRKKQTRDGKRHRTQERFSNRDPKNFTPKTKNEIAKLRRRVPWRATTGAIFGCFARQVCGLCALWIRATGILPRSFGRRVFPLVYRRRGVPARGVTRRRDAGA